MKITKRKAESLLRKYAKAQPQRVARAAYTDYDHETPECIVGHVLINDLDVPAHVLDGEYFDASRAAEVGGVELTKGAAVLFDVTQRFQDGRANFGHEADIARRVAGTPDFGRLAWGKAVEAGLLASARK